MNYRDFFKNKKFESRRDIKSLLPEGVTLKEFYKGVAIENETVNDKFTAAKLASENLKKDSNHYKKLYENVYDDVDVTEFEAGGEGDEYDDNGGLPLVGGALAVPHVGQPINLGKIVQVGASFGQGPATGELSGMSSVGGVDKGVKVTQDGDKEPIVAGGKGVSDDIACKSTGGTVVPGKGQSQGGPNHKGSIAGTSKLAENKEKVRRIVNGLLKEITYNEKTGKWEKISETVDMKMGASYKTVQPRQYKVVDDDVARTNQYEPEISETVDEEQECVMNERYVELATASRNLSESELSELKELRTKIDELVSKRLAENGMRMKMGPSYKVVADTQARVQSDDQARNIAFDPKLTEMEFGHENQESECPKCGNDENNEKLNPTDSSVICGACGHTFDLGAEAELGAVEEIGGQAIQHRSFRTAKDNHQNPEARWSDEVYEGMSQVARTIRKGMKPKKTKKRS